MKGKHLQQVIVLGTIVLTCLLVIQVYWFKRAFDTAEQQFDHRVQIALKKVADSVSHTPEVKKLSSNFYFVSTESNLNDQALDDLLKHELLLRSLSIDYELGVYNADDDTLVYGNYVKATQPNAAATEVVLPGQPVAKNFAVYFPRKQSYLAAQLDIWIFSTFMVLLMMGFFAYAIVSLLRERRFAELKSDFVNNMTHEFKTPVTNIRIAGEVLKNKTSTPADSQVYIDILLKENEKLRRKIDEVLLGSSADHLKRPALENLDIHQLLADCAETFQLKIQQRHGHIQLNLRAETPHILGDRELLAQAISNIIDNAEKYTLSTPQIIVETRNSSRGIEIGVTDNGIGIAPRLKHKVFEKFFRVPSGDVHNVKGFGLGLNFVQSVIKLHRGRVDLESALNKGTDVRIYLPQA